MLQLFCFIGNKSASNMSPHRFTVSMPRKREEFREFSHFAVEVLCQFTVKNDDNRQIAQTNSEREHRELKART